MLKGRAFVLVTLTVGLGAFAAIACGEDSTSTFGETQPDAGPADTGPGFNLDAGVEPDSSEPVDCNPKLAATFAPVWKAPTKTGACSAQELGEYYDACLTPPSPDAGDAGDPCKTWTDAHPGCTQCVEPTDNSGPIQWHRDRFYYTLNVAGCLALERGEPEDGKCPATYNASIQCQRAACDGCFATQGATFADFQTCQKSAKGGECASYEGKIGEICGTTYNDPDGGAYDCFRQGNDNAKTHFVRVEGIFCGQ